MLAPVSSDMPSNDAHSKVQQEKKLITDKNIAEFKKFMNSTQLQINIQEIISNYSALENYFMTENINKAIQMDTVNRNSLTSSVVDDTFFIIKKCIKYVYIKEFHRLIHSIMLFILKGDVYVVIVLTVVVRCSTTLQLPSNQYIRITFFQSLSQVTQEVLI